MIKERITLFWMDMIRDRLQKYPFKNNNQRKLINDFLKPIVLCGRQSELDINVKMKESILDANAQAQIERKEIENFARILKEYEVESNAKKNKRKKTKIKRRRKGNS